MVYQMVYVARLELVEKWHWHGTVSEGCKEGDCPVCLVAGTDGDSVTLLNTALLEKNVEFLHLAGYILVAEGCTFVIGDGREFPVIANTPLDDFVY